MQTKEEEKAYWKKMKKAQRKRHRKEIGQLVGTYVVSLVSAVILKCFEYGVAAYIVIRVAQHMGVL